VQHFETSPIYACDCVMDHNYSAPDTCTIILHNAPEGMNSFVSWHI